MAGPGPARWPAALAASGFVVVAVLVLFLAASPLTTNDLWWHLAHGRAFLAHGLFAEHDPCLATASGGAIPHQWLFAVAARGVEQVAGLHGLRVLHALAVAGITWLAFAAFRREAGGRVAPAALAACAFLVLSWYRLIQLRPELFSIAAVLLLERLLFAPALPSWRRVAGSVALVAVWANVHAAFAVGPLLIAVALCGAAARAAALRLTGLDGASVELRRTGRLGAALVLGLVAALANPRGVQQHLAFLSATSEGAIWDIVDEWASFDPFAHTNMAPAVSELAWLASDALLALFLVAALLLGLRFLRAPDRARLEACDPVRLALGLASIVALLVSIRFVWLAVFPLLFLLAAARRLPATTGFEAACAAASVGLAVAFPLVGGFATAASHFPQQPGAWLADGYTGRRFFGEGVRFLKETGVQGTLFHTYGAGGFLCHQLAPQLRTFVDGSMNFPEDVAADYRNVSEHRGSRPGETAADVLERRGVDFFFGVGVPMGAPRPGATEVYTTVALESDPRWLLVSRSLRHAVYLRANARNRENLARIAEWYAAQRVPFDPARGLDPDAVIAASPEWAQAWGLLPEAWPELVAAERLPAQRLGALEQIGLVYALAGAYESQLANDRLAVAARPLAEAPRRRLVYALLHLGRADEALAEARALRALDRGDPRAAVFEGAARRLAADPGARSAVLAVLPLLSSRHPLRQ